MTKFFDTGIMRVMDDLGRVILPKAIREKLGFKEGDRFTIAVSSDGKSFSFTKVETEQDNQLER